MDTSAEYIEMFQKAEQIQKRKQFGRNWQKGDWYYDAFYGMSHVYNEEFKSVEGKIRDAIWLPRQDQLPGKGKKPKPRVLSASSKRNPRKPKTK